MIDLRQAPAYRKFQASQNWHHLALGKSFLAWRKLPLWPWPVAKFQRAPLPDIKILNQVGQKLKLGTFYLEPSLISPEQEKQLTQTGWQLNHQPFLPTKTVVLDLHPSLIKIQANFKKDTRYCLKKAQANQLKIKTGCGQTFADQFHRGWRQATGWKILIPTRNSFRHLTSSFGQHAYIQLAYQDNKLLGGNLILVHQKTAYYYYAFANQPGRKFLASYLLVWEAIRWAKKLGCNQFDFEGIYDPVTNLKAWQGFTHFKKSFGGKEVSYPNSWQKKFNPRLHK